MDLLVDFETEEIIGYGTLQIPLDDDYNYPAEIEKIYISTKHADAIHKFKNDEMLITLRMALCKYSNRIIEVKGKITSYDCQGIYVKLDKVILLQEGL